MKLPKKSQLAIDGSQGATVPSVFNAAMALKSQALCSSPTA